MSRESEPWLAVFGRVGVYAIVAAVFSWPLVSMLGVASAVGGAISGAIAGPLMARSRLRTHTIAAIGVVSLVVMLALRQWMVRGDFLAGWIGPTGVVALADAFAFGFGAFAVSTTLRALSSRHRVLSVIEVCVAGLAFAQLVVAHRHGAINRPFSVADPIIAAGSDPTIVFLTVGVFCAAAVILLLLNERNFLRTVLHLTWIALLLALVVGTTQMLGLPTPDTAAGLGLRPNEDGQANSKNKQPDSQDGRARGGRSQNNDMDFRDNYNSSGNQVPVGVVLFHDDYSPPTGIYYFRQGAFSEYNGRRLISATRADVDLDIADAYPGERTPIRDAPEMNSNRREIETTVAMLAEHNQPFALESPLTLEPAQNPDPTRFRRMYRATSGVLVADYVEMLGANVGGDDWTPDQLAHYTEAPGDARYRELAERLVGELPDELRNDEVAQVFAITDWLGRQGTYSLRSRHAQADDPTADFLFGDLTGYCVHFAHAATYLFRSLDIPSRVATGYAIDESARQGGSSLLVSGESSHAWPEVYLDEYGWVIADVSPDTVIDPPPQPPDPDLQRLLGELARGQNPNAPDTVRKVQERLGELREAGVTVVRALGGLAVLGLLFLMVAKIWRRLAPSFSSERALPRVLYRAQLDRLSELALMRERGESREAFARRIAEICPSFKEVTSVHVGSAFGSQDIDLSVLREGSRQMRVEVGGHFPWWRRFVGTITPWSWLWSR